MAFIRSRPTTASAYGMHTLVNMTAPLSRSMPTLPKYVENDKVVLRFHGHIFQSRNWDPDSPIGNPTIEEEITRRLTIYYYIIDDTISIIEEKTQNTGIVGGEFYKRGPLLYPNGEPVAIRDLTPGKSLQVLGIEIFITDADTFTREYFRREFGFMICPPLPRPEIVREDLGAQYATGLGLKPNKRDRSSYGTTSTDYLTLKDGLQKTFQFLQHDGTFICFICVELPRVDPHNVYSPLVNPRSFRPTSTMRKYVLRYYLGDNNVEVRAMKGAGEDAKILLKKNKLPKNWREVQRGVQAQFFDAVDFRCGSTVDIYGRVFLLTSCDEFTKDYLANRGFPQSQVSVVQEVEQPIVHKIPQLGDGFLPIGKPEDTLATIYGQPKVGQNVKAVLRNHNRQLICRAKLLTHEKIDSTRKFQITFFMEDSSLQVFEEVERNAGIWGGSFLKRGKYVNDLPPDDDEPRPFKPTDIFLGNVISLNGYDFQIYEMDNMGLLFCEAFPEEFPMFDTFVIVHSLVQKAISRKLDIRREFTKVDPSGEGSLDRETFIMTLDRLGLSEDLNDQELLTLTRRFKEGERYMYLEMADIFSQAHYIGSRGRGAATEALLIVDLPTFLLGARSRNTQWRRTLRKDPQTWQGKVLLGRMLKIFKKHGVTTPASVVPLIAAQYGVRGPLAELTIQNIARLVEPDNVGRGKVAGKRADLRSKHRADSTLHDEGVGGGASRASIGKRRGSLTGTSIMRTYQQNTAVVSSGPVEDYSNVVVDTNALCNDIYISDWL